MRTVRMRIAPMSVRALLVILTVKAALSAGPHFVMQYLYDQDKTELHLIDLKFPSARYGMAAGAITDGKKTEPAVVITTDAGAHWSVMPLKDVLPSKDVPLSLYFASETQGWMVTGKGLWFTSEFGRGVAQAGRSSERDH